MTYYPSTRNDGNHVFVFGSNLAGRHGKGAAYVARKLWGAVNGIGKGPQGRSYAIPTKDARLKPLLLNEIQAHVADFLAYAASKPGTTFLVTRIGCGLAGYNDRQIKPMFASATANVVLPFEWLTDALHHQPCNL